MNKYKNFLALLFSGIVFGSFGIWIRILSRELTSYQQIFARNFFGFIICCIVILLLKQKWNFSKVNKIYVILYGICFPLSVIFYTFSILSTKIAITTFAFYAASFIGSFVIGKVLFSDKIHLIKVVSLSLAFLGIFILSYKSFSTGILNWGFIFGFLGGFLDSCTNAFRRFLASKIESFVLVSIQMIGGIVVATLFMLIFAQKVPSVMSPITILVAVLFGFLLVGLNFLLNFGFQDFDLNLGTILLSTELVAAPIFGLLIFKESLALTDIIGGGFIIFAILLSNFKHLSGIRLHKNGNHVSK